MGNTHPRFWSWFMGNGTAFAAVGDFLAAIINPNMGGGNHMPNQVEAQVVDWCKEIVGMPPDASGLLVSGGSMANFVGLAVARNARAGIDVRELGVAAIARPLVTYASVEVHSCVQKAIESLGLGARFLHQVPVNARYEIDVGALERMIEADRAAGLQPFCVVGNAATINTGATDDLDALATVCAREGLWFHVDGAIGALLALAPAHRHLVRGMERADSVTLDLHKWLHIPFEAACVLVRDRKAHRSAFALTPEYLEKTERGLASGNLWFSEYGLQLSRGFRALKVWLSIKEHGLDRFGRLIDRNIAQAHELAALVEAEPRAGAARAGRHQHRLLSLQPGRSGRRATQRAERRAADPAARERHRRAVVHHAAGRYCLRAAIANFRTTQRRPAGAGAGSQGDRGGAAASVERQHAERRRVQALHVEHAVVLGGAAGFRQPAGRVLQVEQHAPCFVEGDHVAVGGRHRPEDPRQPQASARAARACRTSHRWPGCAAW